MCARSCRRRGRPLLLPRSPPPTVTGPARSTGGWSTRWLRQPRERSRGRGEDMHVSERVTHMHVLLPLLLLRALPVLPLLLRRAKVLSDQSEPPRV